MQYMSASIPHIAESETRTYARERPLPRSTQATQELMAGEGSPSSTSSTGMILRRETSPGRSKSSYTAKRQAQGSSDIVRTGGLERA